MINNTLLKRIRTYLPIILFFGIFIYLTAFSDVSIAAETAKSETYEQTHHGPSPDILLYLAIILIAAKVGGIVDKIGLPAVLGELFAGIVLAAIGFLGVPMIRHIVDNTVVMFLAQLGAIILLFQVGLESNITEMMRVGKRSLIVALIGIVVPFTVGTFIVGPYFFQDETFTAHLFIGASIVATSVGITAAVFKSLGIFKSNTAKTVIGAAVIDDILGLVILAVVSAIASGQEVSLTEIIILTAKSFAFLGGAIMLGTYFAKPVSQFFSYIHTGKGMKLGIVVIIALVYAYAATLIGLEPIIGAFAAGLILDAVHFSSFDTPKVAQDLAKLKGYDKEEKQAIADLTHQLEHTHVEDMIEDLAHVFVPLFFVYTGMQINIQSLLNPSIYFVAAVVTIIAIITKLVAGIAAEGGKTEKIIVGMSMVPRGEVGLIFISIGAALGAISPSLFSILLIVIVLTTFIAPIAIKSTIQKSGSKSIL